VAVTGRRAALVAALALAFSPVAPATPVPAIAAAAQRVGGQGVDLQRRLGDIEVVRTPEGDRVKIGEENVDAEAYVARIFEAQQEQRGKGFLYALFNITTPWGILWVGLGFAGQALFTFRMVLQWLASEKQKRSVIPVAFWWGSLFGGLMLLAYFSWRKDIVGVVGQSTGAFVYARNLILIYRNPAPRSI
jgi:lipid-A-disaccharide synthase-like uncharacterized protein